MPMEKKVVKTKLGELAKDLKVSNGDIVKCLETYDGETRKTQASLVPEEVGYVLEYFTQNNQVENFNEYFANNIRYGAEDAEDVVIAMGSVSGAAREAVDQLIAEGRKVGKGTA